MIMPNLNADNRARVNSENINKKNGIEIGGWPRLNFVFFSTFHPSRLNKKKEF
jgi:hypothetical protein